MIESLQSNNQALQSKNQALLDHTKELQELISELRKENKGSKTASCVPTYQTDFQGGIVSSQRRGNGRTEAEQIHRGANIDMGVGKDGSPREWQAETFLGDKNHIPSSSCSSSPLIPSNGGSSPEMSFAFNPAEPCLQPISENHLWTDPYELDEFQLYSSNHHDQLDCHLKYPISTLDEESTMQTQSFDDWYSLGSDQRSSEYPSGLIPSLFNRNTIPALTTSVTTLSGSSYTGEDCRSNEPTYALPLRQIHSKTSIDTSTISRAISRYMTEFEYSKNILGLSQMEPSANFENNQHLGRSANDEMSTSTTMSFGLMSPPTQDRAPAPVPMKVVYAPKGFISFWISISIRLSDYVFHSTFRR
ncbi:hypothetical protein [Phaffia rhodozyma]|uniref:Uncharacterized protein n=1 Tax=Phaffia rhodozyma TaxID=264483 RepID=A0A0F7SJ34_PHARH|nr:hypothetical protein [Phaffia rhodozyma]